MEGRLAMQEKKNILTYEGLKKYEDELQELSGLQKEEKMQSKYDEWKDYLESLSLRLSNKKEV